MTNSDTPNSVTHAGDGSTTVFPFSFYVPEEGHVRVGIHSEKANETTWLDRGGFTLALTSGGGTVTVTCAPGSTPIPAGRNILIERRLPYDQDVDFSNEVQQPRSVLSTAYEVLPSSEEDPDAIVSEPRLALLTADPVNDVASAVQLLENGATGDGVTDDSTAWATTEQDNSYIWVPEGTFNLGTHQPTKPVTGPGKLKYTKTGVGTATVEDFLLGFDPIRSIVRFTPNIWAETATGIGGVPEGDSFYNTIVSPGTYASDSGQNVKRSNAFGSQNWTAPIELERVDAFGNDAMRYAGYAERTTALGSTALEWLGQNLDADPEGLHYRHPYYADSNVDPSVYDWAPGTTKYPFTVASISKANPGVVTTTGNHGMKTGRLVKITGVSGMTQVNGVAYVITRIDSTHFSIGVDTTGYGTYSSGGTGSALWNWDDFEVWNPGIGAIIGASIAGVPWAICREEALGNVAVGRDAGNQLVKGNYNSVVGYKAMAHSFIASENVAVGYGAAQYGAFVTNQVALGTGAGSHVMQGSGGVFLGDRAGQYRLNVTDSVLIGKYAGEHSRISKTLSNAFILHVGATGSDKTPLMAGQFNNNKLGIGVVPDDLNLLAGSWQVHGHTSDQSSTELVNWANAGTSPQLRFRKSMGDSTGVFGTATGTSDSLGLLRFYGSTTTDFLEVARIQVEASGTTSSTVNSGAGAARGRIRFMTGNASSSTLAERMSILETGVVKVGGAYNTVRATTEGTNHLDIFDCAAIPVGALANGVSLYSFGGKLWAMDAAGAATKLTP